MADRVPNDAEEARRRARERLAARQERRAVEEGRRPAKGSRRERSESRGTRRAEQSEKDEPQGGSGVAGALGGAVRGFVGAVGLKRIAIVLGAILVSALLVFGIASLAHSCSAEQPPEPDESVQDEGQGGEPEPVSIPEGLDAELTGRLETAAAGNSDIAWIANHANDYAVDGDVVQYKLLKLAVDEPEAVAFVRGFPEAYPADGGDPYEEEIADSSVPRLYQWDPRWGYTVYSSTTFALTGCCPTSLSMVYMGLTGKTDITPYDMGLRAQNGGYMTQYDGTDGAFLVNEAASLGLSCTEIGVSSDALRETLEGGNVVICNVGPGDFTEGGHYFVITGIADDGTVSVNDPYSAERSSKTWDIDQVIGQTKALYSYALA